MPRRLLALVFMSAAIAGCASKPVQVADNTPLNPTALIETHITNNGIKGLFPFESNDTHYVRANMRRDESTFKGTGTFSGFLVGSHSGTKIARIDRRLLWSLNTEKEEYTECPLTGCAEPVRPAAKQNGAAKQPEAQHESGCTMQIAGTNFMATPTGQKKSINGFDTDEYKVAWVVHLRDKAARTTTSTLSLDIWTTPMTQSMRDAIGLEAAYARAYAGSATDTTRQQIVPADAAKLISSYLANSLTASDRNAFLDAGKQLQKIKGYPISTQLTWNMAGNACAPKETAKEDKSSRRGPPPTSAGGLVSGIAGMFAEKKTEEAMNESGGEPILSFTVEVKALKVEPLHDSLFTVPANYRLVQQK